MTDTAPAATDVRYEQVDLHIGGVALRTAAVGRNGDLAPVVFLHGFGSTKEDYLDIACQHAFAGRPFLAYEVVALIEAARKRSVNVQANVYPYTRGNNNLASIIPPWAHEGGAQALIQRLKDPALRPRLEARAGMKPASIAAALS